MLRRGLLSGKKVRLTSLAEEDLDAIACWHHDENYMRLSSDDPAIPQSREVLKRWFFPQDDRHAIFAIRPLSREQLLGFLTLEIKSRHNRHCELSLGIGEPGNRGQGYGTEAIQLGVNFAFHELNLHRIELGVFSYNERAIALYKRLGFRHEGTLREFLRRDGRWYDMLVMSMLSHEWAASPVAEPWKER